MCNVVDVIEPLRSWLTAAPERLRHQPLTAPHRSETATLMQTPHKEVGKSLSTMRRIFQSTRRFGVLFCAVHCYAVRNLENHLRLYHSGSGKEALLRKSDTTPMHFDPYPAFSGASLDSFLWQRSRSLGEFMSGPYFYPGLALDDNGGLSAVEV